MSEFNEVLEYLFFNQKIANLFAGRLEACGLPYQEEIEATQQAIILKISEEVDDELWNELDDYYDELSIEDQALLEAGSEDDSAKSTAGVYLQLSNGQQTIAQVDPEVMKRILSTVTMDEFNEFVDIIVRSVEKPDDGPICQK